MITTESTSWLLKLQSLGHQRLTFFRVGFFRVWIFIKGKVFKSDLQSQSLIFIFKFLKHFFPIISSNKFTIHVTWLAHREVTLYSTSYDDNAITYYFLEFQATNAPPNLNTNLTVDFLSSTSPHQLESVYPTSLH